jgi:GT2 family glycosyltransferase
VLTNAGGSRPSVAITIVTHNSDRYIAKCLEYVFAQDYSNFEVILIDNASRDSSAAILRMFSDRAIVVCNRENKGFAGGQNQAIGLSDSDWVLTLNPDVRLTPNFLTEAVRAGVSDASAGTVCGKLLTLGEDFEVPERPEFDSTGIFFTPNLRHFDRGSRQRDEGQYDAEEYVFGATGAAALYRRRMIEELCWAGEFFDTDFFAYREDADVAWRSQWLGWKCRYAPRAVAYHVRRVLPETRRLLPSEINMHSVKNRFLMRIKNATWPLYKRHGLAIAARDCLVLAGCVSYEIGSIRAIWLVLRYLPRTYEKRRDLMRRRRSTEAYIVSWFSYDPVSFPVPCVAADHEPR